MSVCGINKQFETTFDSIVTSVAKCLSDKPTDDHFTSLLKMIGKVALIASAVLFAIPTFGAYPYFVYRVCGEIFELEKQSTVPALTIFASPKPVTLPQPQATQQIATAVATEQSKIKETLDAFASQHRAALSTKAQSALDKITLFFSQEAAQLTQAWEKHALHDAITEVTEEVKSSPDLQKQWRAFLTLHPRCIFPDGRATMLDFSLELQRLDGKKVFIDASCLVPDFHPRGDLGIVLPQELIQEITEVIHDSFPLDALAAQKQAAKCCSEYCIVARDSYSNNICGALFYKELFLSASNSSVIYIHTVCRKANASRLGVGSALFNAFFDNVKKNRQLKDKDIILHVDKDNAAACALYKKCGMTISEDFDKYAVPSAPLLSNNLLFVCKSNGNV